MKVLFGIALCVGFSSAFFLNSGRTVAATTETDPQCFAHGSAGRCEFYSCFEDRLECGSRGYMNRYGGYYCERFSQFYNSFNDQAKRWINETSVCMTERLLAYYNQESVQCHDLSHFAWDAWSECYHDHGFCDVFWDNRRAFYDVYQIRDFFSFGSGKIWREMFQIVARCLAQRGASEFEERGGFSGVMDSLRNLGNRFRTIIPQ